MVALSAREVRTFVNFNASLAALSSFPSIQLQRPLMKRQLYILSVRSLAFSQPSDAFELFSRSRIHRQLRVVKSHRRVSRHLSNSQLRHLLHRQRLRNLRVNQLQPKFQILPSTITPETFFSQKNRRKVKENEKERNIRTSKKNNS